MARGVAGARDNPNVWSLVSHQNLFHKPGFRPENASFSTKNAGLWNRFSVICETPVLNRFTACRRAMGESRFVEVSTHFVRRRHPRTDTNSPDLLKLNTTT
jgi:hypothetical protein